MLLRLLFPIFELLFDNTNVAIIGYINKYCNHTRYTKGQMLDYQGEKLKKFLEDNRIPVQNVANLIGVNRQTVYKYFRSRSLSREVVTRLTTALGISESEIWGNNKNTPRLEAEPLYLASDPNDFNNDGSRFEDLGNGMLRMRVPIVPQKAYAGYLRGYQDPEFFEDFPTLSFEVLKEHRGHYVAFEVRGDSMVTTNPDEFDQMALPGWKAVGREVPRHHWQYKLHTHKTDTWVIVHRTEGILIKSIVEHNVDEAKITVHSLNPAYPDETFSLNDINQIFSVVKFIIDK